MLTEDTIAAIATAPGKGGIGIVRVSGPGCAEIAREILGVLPRARRAHHTAFRDSDGEALDEGIALFFPAPASFTGEDVLELQGHGGPMVLDMLLARVLALGARIAGPGEFSQRAFLNDKLDLAQAEAIADLIESGSAQAARAALRSLQGAFSERVRALVEGLVGLRGYVEAAIDFPEEEVDFLADAEVTERLTALLTACGALEGAARQGRLLREGMTVVIAGPPNAGKSSLLNALAGYEAAIVTEIPGTTRDVLREHIAIDGMPLHVIDTAGLRATQDRIEREGIRRAREELERADRVLLVVDGSTDPHAQVAAALPELPEQVPVTVVENKLDVRGGDPRVEPGPPVILTLSARTGAGIAGLRAHLMDVMGYGGEEAGAISARRRHLDALRRGKAHLLEARRQLEDYRAGELMAEELRLAQEALNEITGEFTSEDLLGRIFASFCIGK
jgi:tRNA modification GTPase